VRTDQTYVEKADIATSTLIRETVKLSQKGHMFSWYYIDRCVYA